MSEPELNIDMHMHVDSQIPIQCRYAYACSLGHAQLLAIQCVQLLAVHGVHIREPTIRHHARKVAGPRGGQRAPRSAANRATAVYG